MIETIFTLEDESTTDEPMTPSTDAPEEGGMEEETEGMPAGLLGDGDEESEETPEALLEEDGEAPEGEEE